MHGRVALPAPIKRRGRGKRNNWISLQKLAATSLAPALTLERLLDVLPAIAGSSQP